MSLIVTEPVSSATPAPTILQGSLPVRLTLAGSVPRVIAGTPLAHQPDTGWVIARPGKTGPAEFFAAEHRGGGESVAAWRSMLVDLHTPVLVTGQHYRVADVDDRGRLELTQDEAGPHLALGPSILLLERG